MRNVPKGQVNPRQRDGRFFGYLVLEVLLRRSRHDEQASVGQSFREDSRAILSFETE